MKLSWRRAGSGILLVAFTLGLVVNAGQSDLQPAMVGTWSGQAHIVVVWCQQKELPVRVEIHPDATVTGTVGDATLLDGRLGSDRGWLLRRLHWAEDYIITGKLQGNLVAAEDIRRERVFIPMGFTNGVYQWGVRGRGKYQRQLLWRQSFHVAGGARAQTLSRKSRQLNSLRQIDEVFEQLQANFLAFFRVELGGEHVVLPDGGGKIVAIFRASGHDGGIDGLRKKAVDEIDVTAAGNPAVKRAFRAGHFDLVPADLGYLVAGTFGEADNLALKHFQAGGAGIELFTAFEQGLITDADTEERFAGLDKFLGGTEQVLFAQGMDAIIERADPRQHEAAGIADLAGMLDQAHVGTHFQQRFMDAAQVSRTVIKQGNHELIIA